MAVDRYDLLAVNTSDKLVDDQGRPRKFFTRVGAMFPNKGGSFGVIITPGLSISGRDLMAVPANDGRQTDAAEPEAKATTRSRSRKSS